MTFTLWLVLVYAVMIALALYVFIKVKKLIGTILFVLIALSLAVLFYLWATMPV